MPTRPAITQRGTQPPTALQLGGRPQQRLQSQVDSSPTAAAAPIGPVPSTCTHNAAVTRQQNSTDTMPTYFHASYTHPTPLLDEPPLLQHTVLWQSVHPLHRHVCAGSPATLPSSPLVGEQAHASVARRHAERIHNSFTIRHRPVELLAPHTSTRIFIGVHVPMVRWRLCEYPL